MGEQEGCLAVRWEAGARDNQNTDPPLAFVKPSLRPQPSCCSCPVAVSRRAGVPKYACTNRLHHNHPNIEIQETEFQDMHLPNNQITGVSFPIITPQVERRDQNISTIKNLRIYLSKASRENIDISCGVNKRIEVIFNKNSVLESPIPATESAPTCVKALAFQVPNKSPFEAQYKRQSLLFMNRHNKLILGKQLPKLSAIRPVEVAKWP